MFKIILTYFLMASLTSTSRGHEYCENYTIDQCQEYEANIYELHDCATNTMNTCVYKRVAMHRTGSKTNCVDSYHVKYKTLCFQEQCIRIMYRVPIKKCED